MKINYIINFNNCWKHKDSCIFYQVDYIFDFNFSGSIYNELIILKVCGLHLNTKTFLEKSSKEDIMQIFLNNDSRYNSEIEEEKIELDDDMIYN